jgi:hypothetical protein
MHVRNKSTMLRSRDQKAKASGSIVDLLARKTCIDYYINRSRDIQICSLQHGVMYEL